MAASTFALVRVRSLPAAERELCAELADPHSAHQSKSAPVFPPRAGARFALRELSVAARV